MNAMLIDAKGFASARKAVAPTRVAGQLKCLELREAPTQRAPYRTRLATFVRRQLCVARVLRVRSGQLAHSLELEWAQLCVARLNKQKWKQKWKHANRSRSSFALALKLQFEFESFSSSLSLSGK